jgi:hypothetical protein
MTRALCALAAFLALLLLPACGDTSGEEYGLESVGQEAALVSPAVIPVVGPSVQGTGAGSTSSNSPTTLKPPHPGCLSCPPGALVPREIIVNVEIVRAGRGR